MISTALVAFCRLMKRTLGLVSQLITVRFTKINSFLLIECAELKVHQCRSYDSFIHF